MRFLKRIRVGIVHLPITLVALAGVFVASGVLASAAQAASSSPGGGFYQQTNLVSDLPNFAQVRDKSLVNSWGLSHSPNGPWQVSDNGTGLSTQYRGDGKQVPPAVTIPTPAGVKTAAPTGNVFNNTIDFVISKNGKSFQSQFIFATEDGTISGWNPSVDATHAILEVDRSTKVDPQGDVGAVYKGLAMGHSDSGKFVGNFLYATNFRFGEVEQFDANFNLVNSFTDSTLASICEPPNGCFAPFGIQSINDKLYVTFALQNAAKHDDVAGPGNGFVDIFDTNGNLLTPNHLISGVPLNSPWGLALAPASFGQFSNDLLVGNFGDGGINAFNPDTGASLGPLRNGNGNSITINGLWGLAFGNGGMAGSTNTLFFASGLNDEADGLFGSITPA